MNYIATINFAHTFTSAADKQPMSFEKKNKYFEIHIFHGFRYCSLDLPHLYNTVPAASDPPGQPGQFRAWLYSSPTIWFVHPIIPWSRCPAVLRCLRTKMFENKKIFDVNNISPMSNFYFWWRQGIYYSFLKNIYSHEFLWKTFFEANFNSILGIAFGKGRCLVCSSCLKRCDIVCMNGRHNLVG